MSTAALPTRRGRRVRPPSLPAGARQQEAWRASSAPTPCPAGRLVQENHTHETRAKARPCFATTKDTRVPPTCSLRTHLDRGLLPFPPAPAPLPLPAAQPQTTVKAQQHNRATEPLTAHMPLLSTQPRRFVSPERTSELRVLLTSEPAALRPGHPKRSRHTQRVPEQPSALHPDSHLFQLLPPCQPCWSQGGCP